MMSKFKASPDLGALLTLLFLWLLFFWRIWTPLDADRLSFAEGDFSSQFASWAHYGASRLQEGEIPLWNPYFYAGAPFQADPQARLTYPPHLLTLLLLSLDDDLQAADTYAALQWEVLLHVLLASLFVYAFVRQLLRADPRVRASWGAFGAFVAAVTYSYSGYLASYPPLQVPLLEAGIWLPLVLLGILNATRGPAWGGRWLLFSGAMLALCLLAGHPQTALFTVYFAVAFLSYRAWGAGWTWRQWLGALVLLGLVSGALAAVQLLPTAEFTRYSYRDTLSFDQKAGGYRFSEALTLLFPWRGELWQPQYLGILPLLLVAVALRQRAQGWGFFLAALLLCTLLAFGGRTVLHSLFYLLLPGMTLFRGQERITFLIVHVLAILAGMGAAHLPAYRYSRAWGRGLGLLLALCLGMAALMFALTLLPEASPDAARFLESALFSAFLLGAAWLVLEHWSRLPRQMSRQLIIGGLLVFDLFSANMMLPSNYEPVPLGERVQEPAYAALMRDGLAPGARVDGLHGYALGYSSAFAIPDIYGSNPLQLKAIQFYTERLPLERRWELLNVQRVNSEWLELPVPSRLVELVETDARGPFGIFALENPRGFAHPVYELWLAGSQAEALNLSFDLDLRQVAILEEAPPPLEGPPARPATVQVQHFAPEQIQLRAESDKPAILTFALPYYPGWQAVVDGEAVPLLRAYGGLSAIYLPAGAHSITLEFAPPLLLPLALLWGLGWALMLLLGLYAVLRPA